MRLDVDVETPVPASLGLVFDICRHRAFLRVAARRRALALLSQHMLEALGAVGPLLLLQHAVAIQGIEDDDRLLGVLAD